MGPGNLAAAQDVELGYVARQPLEQLDQWSERFVAEVLGLPDEVPSEQHHVELLALDDFDELLLSIAEATPLEVCDLQDAVGLETGWKVGG